MHAVTTVPRVAEYPRPVARQIDKDGFAVGAAQVSAGAAPRPGSGQREPSPSPRPGGWPGDRVRTQDRAAQALDRHHAQAADVATPWVKRRTSAMSSFGKFHPDPVRAGAGAESTQRTGGAGRCQRGRCAASHQLTQQRVQLVDGSGPAVGQVDSTLIEHSQGVRGGFRVDLTGIAMERSDIDARRIIGP